MDRAQCGPTLACRPKPPSSSSSSSWAKPHPGGGHEAGGGLAQDDGPAALVLIELLPRLRPGTRHRLPPLRLVNLLQPAGHLRSPDDRGRLLHLLLPSQEDCLREVLELLCARAHLAAGERPGAAFLEGGGQHDRWERRPLQLGGPLAPVRANGSLNSTCLAKHTRFATSLTCIARGNFKDRSHCKPNWRSWYTYLSPTYEALAARLVVRVDEFVARLGGGSGSRPSSVPPCPAATALARSGVIATVVPTEHCALMLAELEAEIFQAR